MRWPTGVLCVVFIFFSFLLVACPYVESVLSARIAVCDSCLMLCTLSFVSKDALLQYKNFPLFREI